MAISSNLSATLSLNTLGGTNSPAPSDTFNSTVALGTNASGPISFTVPANGSPLVLPTVASLIATAAYHLMIAHTGVSTDPGIILDMIGTGPVSSQLTINPGGRIYFYNCTVTIAATANKSRVSLWTVQSTTASTTTASVSLVFT